jgi:hypothetical protein
MDIHERLAAPGTSPLVSSYSGGGAGAAGYGEMTGGPAEATLYQPLATEQQQQQQSFDPHPDTLPSPPPCYHPATYVDMLPVSSPPPYRPKGLEDAETFSIRSSPL